MLAQSKHKMYSIDAAWDLLNDEKHDDDGSDLQEADVYARIRHRRKLGRTYIDILTRAGHVRVPINQHTTTGTIMEKGSNAISAIQAAGLWKEDESITCSGLWKQPHNPP